MSAQNHRPTATSKVEQSAASTLHSSNNFDLLRLTFAILVILSHSWWVIDGSYISEPLHVVTNGQTTIGSLAVAGFFMISGYLITGSWYRSRSVVHYVSNRARRIIPGYLVVVLAAAIFVAPVAGVTSWSFTRIVEWTRQTLMFAATTDADAFTGNPIPTVINVSLWTIRYEILCYIWLPIYLTIQRFLPKWMIIVPLFILSVLAGMHVRWTGLSHANLYSCFLSGAAAFILSDSLKWNVYGVAVSSIALVLGNSVGLLDVVIPFAGAYLLFFVALLPSRLSRFGKYGDFSYGVYLYAFPIQQLFAQSWADCGTAALFVMSTLLSITCGIVSWFAVEKRFLKRTPRIPLQSTCSEQMEGALDLKSTS